MLSLKNILFPLALLTALGLVLTAPAIVSTWKLVDSSLEFYLASQD